MNDLLSYFANNKGRLIYKWNHYFEIYERHFARFRNQNVHLLEIGVFHGGSLQMWKHYFGKNARIFGVDTNPKCKAFEEENVQVFVGSQGNANFLRELKAQLPQIDILIDDGGHTMQQQITTFRELFPHIAENGVYLCEDLHTSYWTRFGGGYRHRNSFIEFSKDLIDELHAWYSKDGESFKITEFTRCAYSMHYYDSILVIEKRKISRPIVRKTGTPSF